MLAAQLSSLAMRHRTDLIFGGPRSDASLVFNSVRLISSRGLNAGQYDKQRLVLLAEANPFASAAPVSESPQEFAVGSTPGVLRGGSWRLGVSICHEILFPDVVSRSVEDGADVLVNVSNDGWLDGGSGVASRQHFAMAVFRAVETRRYLVRAATTGVSGVVDPYGRITKALPPGTGGVLTASVAGRTALTPYVRFGDAFAFFCLAATAALALSRRTVRVAHPPRLAFPASRSR
jgi:apolipoprotein N-acyltransferase